MVNYHVGIPGKPGARSFWRGWPITWDGLAWRFDNDNSPTPGWGGEFRPCVNCGAMMNDHEPDYCLGRLPGVDNACCGHGKRTDSYIRFTNGVVIRDFIVEYPEPKE